MHLLQIIGFSGSGSGSGSGLDNLRDFVNFLNICLYSTYI